MRKIRFEIQNRVKLVFIRTVEEIVLICGVNRYL